MKSIFNRAGGGKDPFWNAYDIRRRAFGDDPIWQVVSCCVEHPLAIRIYFGMTMEIIGELDAYSENT